MSSSERLLSELTGLIIGIQEKRIVMQIPTNNTLAVERASAFFPNSTSVSGLQAYPGLASLPKHLSQRWPLFAQLLTDADACDVKDEHTHADGHRNVTNNGR